MTEICPNGGNVVAASADLLPQTARTVSGRRRPEDLVSGLCGCRPGASCKGSRQEEVILFGSLSYLSRAALGNRALRDDQNIY